LDPVSHSYSSEPLSQMYQLFHFHSCRTLLHRHSRRLGELGPSLTRHKSDLKVNKHVDVRAFPFSLSYPEQTPSNSCISNLFICLDCESDTLIIQLTASSSSPTSTRSSHKGRLGTKSTSLLGTSQQRKSLPARPLHPLYIRIDIRIRAGSMRAVKRSPQRGSACAWRQPQQFFHGQRELHSR